MVTLKKPQDAALADLLASHPEVKIDGESSESRVLEIQQGSWTRQLFWGDHPASQRGLMELMDNNPVVCADTVSVPGPHATLISIALGPILRAGLVLADPVIHASQTPDEPNDIMAHLENLGWNDSATLAVDETDFQNVLVVNVMVEVPLMDDYDQIDELYDEAYGRSFYVRRTESETWDTELVTGRPYAAYRLRLTVGESNALLTVQVMADRDGKAGACQVLHALNVMVGNEECLGIPDSLAPLQTV